MNSMLPAVTDAPPGSAEQICDAEAARRYIGQEATPDVVAQARQASGASGARTLKPGQMVTMEYNAGRLNLDVDTANLITDVRCG